VNAVVPSGAAPLRRLIEEFGTDRNAAAATTPTPRGGDAKKSARPHAREGNMSSVDALIVVRGR
jgi:hypothetical protein